MYRIMQNHFVPYTVIAGLLIAYYSVVSDHIPYETQTGLLSIHFAVATILNDIVTWFLFAMATGHIFGKSLKSATLHAAIATSFAIVLYLALERVAYGDWRQIFSTTSLEWLVMTFIGGSIGGAVGHLWQKMPVVLASLGALIIFRFITSGGTWTSPLTLTRNTFLIIILIGIVSYWLYRIFRRVRS